MNNISKHRRRFLEKHKNITVPVTTKVTPDSLRTFTIKHLFANANFDELMNLQAYIDDELEKRGHDVTVVLSINNTNFENRCVSDELYIEVLRFLVTDYITTNYPQLSESQSKKVIDFVLSALSAGFDSPNKKMVVNADTIGDDYGLTVDGLAQAFTSCKTLIDILDEYRSDNEDNSSESSDSSDSDTSIDWLDTDYCNENSSEQDEVFDEHGEDNEDESVVPSCLNDTTGQLKYYKYVTMDLTNPYLIAAVQKLHSQGHQTPGVILTTIRVPFGKRIQQRWHRRYGDYVKFVPLK